MSLRFGGLPMWQIGAEGGLWDKPVPVSALVLAPAERADVLIDFRGLGGRTLLLRNDTPVAPVSTPDERGFKDTVKANPGFFTTIRAKWELPTGVTGTQSYVHHCHIVEHEDNEMMRPFTVTP